MPLTPFVDAETRRAVSLRAMTSDAAVSAAWWDELDRASRERTPGVAGDTHLLKYAASCPVPSARPPDYALREVDLGADGRFLAGIHFLKLDVHHPFVGVLARDTDLRDAAHARRVARALAGQLALFSPESVWFFQPDGAEEFSLGEYPGGKLDQHLLAAPARAMRAASPQHLERVATRPPEGGWYQRYATIYHRFLVTHPHHRFLSMESEEDLTRCLQEGALLELLVDDRYAGLIAAVPETRAGAAGYAVWEILLDDPWRGKHLAAACHRRLADQLPGDALIWGTIDARNTPSRRAAQTAGRQIVGRWWFLPTPPGR